MPLRTRLFIMISLVVLFILVVSLFLVVSSRKKAATESPAGEETTQSTPGQTQTPGTSNTQPTPAIPPVKLPPTTLEIEQNAVKQLAKVFVERYNTFSTDNNLQNIREVEELVTPTLWKKLSSRLGSNTPAPFYMVVTTQALSTALSDWQGTTATITLQTRKVTEKNGATTTTNETILVKMVKQGDKWLADSFAVQK